MKKEEIITELQRHDQTILSFKDRGPWGSSSYRGNCSGWIQAFLIWKYQVQKFAELFAGSGTGSDVAKDFGIRYIGADLNPVPVRPDILCVNAITDEVPEAFCDADFLFAHPPYGAEIRIPYAGSMYADPTGELSKSDLGQMPWDMFMQTLNECIMKYYSAMKSGSRMGILMGDVRRGGLHSMLTDIVKPGELEQILIKTQHNCVSDRRQYQSRSFVPINHEYLLVMRKPGGLVIGFVYPAHFSKDIRDCASSTWRDTVAAVLRDIGRSASLDEIYSRIEGHDKTRTNPHWKEKIRQTLQMSRLFESPARGVWQMAAV